MTARAVVRGAARWVALDTVAAGQQLQRRSRHALGRPRVHFLYLHDVPRPRLGALGELVDRLARRHFLVGHDEAVRRLVVGEIDRPYVSLSFDDAFASNREAGTLLARRGVSACFFVPTGFVGCGSVDEARRFFRTERGVNEPAMTWGDVEVLLEQGHEIGNHTVSHPDLHGVSGGRLRDEIEGAAEELRRRLGGCKHFAWPLGRWQHFGASARDEVFRSGHASCSSAERGAHVIGVDGRAGDLCLRREHVVAGWPWRHVSLFLARSSQRADATCNAWPSSWPGAR